MSSDSAEEHNASDTDSEGLKWIGGETFYITRVEKRKMTKEDSTYGIFGETDVDTRFTRNRQSRRTNEPMTFVSSNIATSTEVTQNSSGIEIILPKEKKSEAEPSQPTETDNDSALPTSFGQKILEGAMRKKQKEQEKEDMQRAWKEAGSSGFAAFERHSKGIASKLMQSMGYKPGEGLGLRKQGIVDPIVQRQRPKGMGMGYGDFREQANAPADNTESQPHDGEEVKNEVSRPRLWRKSNAHERKQRQYKTAEELMSESEDAWKVQRIPTILDMRGPKTRILTDPGKIGTDITEDNRPFPELQHNVDLMVEIAEGEIKELNMKLKSTQDITILTQREERRLIKECEEHEVKAQRIEQLKQGSNKAMAILDITSNMATLLNIYATLKDEVSREFNTNCISMIAMNQVLPYFEEIFRDWSPFEEPGRGVDALRQWKDVLTLHDENFAVMEENPFALLLLHLVIPPLRRCIVNQWNPRQPEQFLEFMDRWNRILPEKLKKGVCHVLVFPRLKVELENWNPRSDAIPVHAWIHPWLVHMDIKLKDLYPVIIDKLIRSLKNWHPPDRSVLVMLLPWKTIFDKKQWDELLTKAILPKLAQSMQDYEVDPLRHDTELARHIVSWTELIPERHIVLLLEEFFFPKWMEVLHHWLTNEPDLAEVSEWYTNWKSIFPPALAEDATIQSFFSRALDCMNRATEQMPIPSMTSVLGEKGFAAKRPTPVTESFKTVFTLRDIVQRYAEENNVSFVPKPGRMHEGFQVYSFGRVSVVLDNQANMVRAQFGHVWRPLSLEQLLEEMRCR